ncbi:MAG: hypothetical protein GY803_03580 [Chloroflexi bacterium]|nr:hypothetical protein [Chloroflexota bacterium]
MSSHSQREKKGIMGIVSRQWKRLPAGFRWNLEDTFQPEDVSERLLPGEEVKLEVHLAWYRDILGLIVFDHFKWLFGIVMGTTAVLLLFSFINGYSTYFSLAPFVLLIITVVLSIRHRIEHQQWRLVRTNARFIISIPQHNAFPLVDNIELKGMPNVMDTNWSHNPAWRVFQFFTGARDVYLSLAAYKFIEGTARVGDALIIPDVMPDDILALRKIIFNVPKPPKPQKVVFPEPQEVTITRD